LTRPVIFLPAARLEVVEAQDWYEAESRGLGARFRAEVDRQVGRLAENPLHFSVVQGDVRRARLQRFPYGMFFRPLQDTIYVLACFHSSRDPMSWMLRV
jgi:toxin ParE1/3/4